MRGMRKLVAIEHKERKVFLLNKDYEDIINLPHHVSKKHPQMSIEQRAAQFAAFAALTGYEEQIEKTGEEFVKKYEE